MSQRGDWGTKKQEVRAIIGGRTWRDNYQVSEGFN
jgi:hypothetical protein